MKFKLFLLTTVVLLFATFSQAENCNAGIIDKAGIIRNTATVAAAARPLVNQGVDVRVVTVDHSTYVYNGSSLAGVETGLEAACPNLIDAKTGLRKANLFVIMVAPQDRQKNIFLGSYYAGSFDIPSAYSQFANASFKAGQWETGIANTLNGTGNQAIAYHRQQVAIAQQRQRVVPVQPQTRVYTQAPAYTPTPTPQTADSGMSGFAIFMVVMFVMLALAIILYFVFRDSSETTTTYTTPDPYVSRSASSGYPTTRRYAGNVPQTVVVNNDNSSGLVTGVLLGEAMSRPNYNPNPVYVEQPVYVAPTPSYVPDPAPVADAPDSTWEEPTQQAAPEETPSFEAPSVDPPSTDFGSNNDSGF